MGPRGSAAALAILLAGCPQGADDDDSAPVAIDDDDSSSQDDDDSGEIAPPDGCDISISSQLCGWYGEWYDPFFGEEPCPEFWEDLPGGDGAFRDAQTMYELPLDELSIEPFPTYIEQRGEEDRWVVRSVGSKCAEATDPAACEAEFDALSSIVGFFEGGCDPGFCWTYLVINRGDDNWLIDSGETLALDVPILQTETDAGFWVIAEINHLEWDAQVREVGDSWQYVVYSMVYSGPVVIHKELVEVRPDRTWQVLRAAIDYVDCDTDI